MSSLTDEQRKMIEEKKKIAQAKLAAKFAMKAIPSTPGPVKRNTNNNNQSTLSNTGSIISPPSSNISTSHNNYNNTQKIIIHGTCELVSKDRFTIHVAYHQQLINIFKSIQNKHYGKCILLKYNVYNIFVYASYT